MYLQLISSYWGRKKHFEGVVLTGKVTPVNDEIREWMARVCFHFLPWEEQGERLGETRELLKITSNM